MRFILASMIVAAWCVTYQAAASEPRIYNVMLLDGQNNHAWRATTPAIASALEETGRFKVTIITAPPANATPEQWKNFTPAYARFDAVVNNFTDWGVKDPTYGPWADDLHKFVREGGEQPTAGDIPGR